MLKYLICGTGKSGTLYFSILLNECGIPCGHESIFGLGEISEARKRILHTNDLEFSNCYKANYGKDVKKIEADSSFMAAPFLSDPILSKTIILHVVRDPMAVVHSFLRLGWFNYKTPNNKFETFAYKHLAKLSNQMTKLERAITYYIEWNRMIEKHSTFFHRIEDGDKILLDYIGIKKKTNLSNDINSTKLLKKPRFDKKINLDLTKQLVKLCKDYGYDKSLRQMPLLRF